MLASTASWDVCTPDPSTELAPYTAARLREVTAAGFSPRPKLLAPLRVLRVEKAPAGGFNVVAAWKAAESLPQPGPLRKPLAEHSEGGGIEDLSATAGVEGSELVVHTAQPPVLCTGFEGSVASSARHLFNLAGDSNEAKGCLAGAPLLTADDESTKVRVSKYDDSMMISKQASKSSSDTSIHTYFYRTIYSGPRSFPCRAYR